MGCGLSKNKTLKISGSRARIPCEAGAMGCDSFAGVPCGFDIRTPED
jgi:hypothetical protein